MVVPFSILKEFGKVTVTDFADLMEAGTPPAIAADDEGVYRIDDRSLTESRPKDEEFSRLVKSVLGPGDEQVERPAVGPGVEALFGGRDVDFSEMFPAGEDMAAKEASVPGDAHDSTRGLNVVDGYLAYDSYFPPTRKVDETRIIKSLVLLSRRFRAVAASIWRRDGEFYRIDYKVGLSDRTLQRFSIPLDSPLGECLGTGTSIVLLEWPLSGVEEYAGLFRGAGRVADEAALKDNRLLFLPVRLQGKDAYLCLSPLSEISDLHASVMSLFVNA
ncbi:MAG: hypothetical protein HC888_15865 [Candidatus Competibacteraceae bacterium]|nr:hypothetical protein [Candidatus Competibacteraceae bacterium]